MQSRWNDKDAAAFCDTYAAWGRELALRVYTSRLIGGDPNLVMHGGGNTSVKAPYRTLLGESVDAIYVKGSGWDLNAIEPRGFPALDQNYLLRLRQLSVLSDEDMVNQLRTHMFDAAAPNPSVETLLHAFIPRRFVDHSHADAILALTNQPHGMDRGRELFGTRLAIVPYVMPGFALSKLAAEAYEAFPECEGLLLYRHGLFTFADDARDSYERHIAIVTLAEQAIAKGTAGKTLFTAGWTDTAPPRERAAAIAMSLRGCLADKTNPEQPRRWIVHHRRGDEILAFANSTQAPKLCRTGPLTPDHVIRTREQALYLANPEYGNRAHLREQIALALEHYAAQTRACFQRHRRPEHKELDALPRVVIAPGAGMFTVGATRKDAMIAADLYEHTIHVKGQAEAMSGYEALPEKDLFDVEYWSLEQAKLGKAAEKPLARQVAVITGAAGAIGRGIAARLAEAGAHVMLLDIDEAGLRAAVAELRARFGNVAECHVCDVTRPDSVEAALDAAALAFGGFDIVVPNAGIAYSAPVDAIDTARLRAVMDVNFMGYFHVIQIAARRLREQGSGGHIIINSSKNVFAPGREFAAYSASKAAGHQLGKIAALELAEHGIRVNMINADAVFQHGETPSGLWQEIGPDRAKARGLTVEQLAEFYRERNLLKIRVTAEHVGNAVVFFASNQTPTTGATLPVDGGIAEAFPR